MHPYVAFYGSKPKLELHAADLYDAKQKAVAHFKPAASKRHMVNVVFVGEPISPAAL